MQLVATLSDSTSSILQCHQTLSVTSSVYTLLFLNCRDHDLMIICCFLLSFGVLSILQVPICRLFPSFFLKPLLFLPFTLGHIQFQNYFQRNYINIEQPSRSINNLKSSPVCHTLIKNIITLLVKSIRNLCYLHSAWFSDPLPNSLFFLHPKHWRFKHFSTDD